MGIRSTTRGQSGGSMADETIVLVMQIYLSPVPMSTTLGIPKSLVLCGNSFSQSGAKRQLSLVSSQLSAITNNRGGG